MCGWTSAGYWTCKQRLCPQCSQRISHKNAGQVVAAVAAMKHPVYTLFTYRSKGLGAPTLRTAVTSFRHGLRLLRERRFFACVRAGVGAIETSLSKDGTVWQVHSHMALDIHGGLEEAVLAAAWKKVTANRGEVQLHDAIYSPSGFATYTTKADTWCPPPGKTNPLHLLEVVMRGVHGRRLPDRLATEEGRTGAMTDGEADAWREQARRRSEHVFDVAEALHALPGGTWAPPSMGFATFGEWSETELGFGKRTAEQYVALWAWLNQAPPDRRERLRSIPWTKLRLLMRAGYRADEEVPRGVVEAPRAMLEGTQQTRARRSQAPPIRARSGGDRPPRTSSRPSGPAVGLDVPQPQPHGDLPGLPGHQLLREARRSRYPGALPRALGGRVGPEHCRLRFRRRCGGGRASFRRVLADVPAQ
ncbi:MAG: protein rep [Myxococcales bacterium]|nr:protein rep [Myxococcales bacterium]